MKYINIFFVLILVISSYSVNAQEPVLNFDFPVEGNTDISTLPLLNISVDYPYIIDTSSVNYTGNDPDIYNWDSVNVRKFTSEINLFNTELYNDTNYTLENSIYTDMFAIDSTSTDSSLVLVVINTAVI